MAFSWLSANSATKISCRQLSRRVAKLITTRKPFFASPFTATTRRFDSFFLCWWKWIECDRSFHLALWLAKRFHLISMICQVVLLKGFLHNARRSLFTNILSRWWWRSLLCLPYSLLCAICVNSIRSWEKSYETARAEQIVSQMNQQGGWLELGKNISAPCKFEEKLRHISTTWKQKTAIWEQLDSMISKRSWDGSSLSDKRGELAENHFLSSARALTSFVCRQGIALLRIAFQFFASVVRNSKRVAAKNVTNEISPESAHWRALFVDEFSFAHLQFCHRKVNQAWSRHQTWGCSCARSWWETIRAKRPSSACRAESRRSSCDRPCRCRTPNPSNRCQFLAMRGEAFHSSVMAKKRSSLR